MSTKSALNIVEANKQLAQIDYATANHLGRNEAIRTIGHMVLTGNPTLLLHATRAALEEDKGLGIGYAAGFMHEIATRLIAHGADTLPVMTLVK